MKNISKQDNHHHDDIDGLRALAIVSVVLGHFFSNSFPSGFIGVDVFFVISGFLIANLVFSEKSKFEIQFFYLSRLRRILPSLVSALLLSIIACTALNVSKELFGMEVMAASVFSSNFLYLSQVSYFDRASEFKILLNMWSLGVEGQFYIVFPLILLISKFSRINLLILVIFISFFVNLIFIDLGKDSYSFFLLITRFWELFLGALVSHIYSKFNPSKVPSTLLALIGFAFLITAALIINKITPYPGWYATLPSIGTALIISSKKNNILSKILEFKPNKVISNISYPLYLYHWPIIAITHTTYNKALESTFFKIILLCFAVLLAYLTHIFIEKPVRKYFTDELLRMRRRYFLSICLISLLIPGLIGLAMYSGLLTNSYEIKNINILTFDSAYRNYPQKFSTLVRSGDCQLDKYSPDLYSPKCYKVTKRPIIVLWGDSHAAHLYPGLNSSLGSSASLFQFSRYCPPFFNLSKETLKQNNLMDERQIKVCNKSGEFVKETLKREKPDILILSAFWTNHFDGSDKLFLNNLINTIRTAKSLGIKQIIVVGIMPTWADSLYKIIEDNFLNLGLSIPQKMSDGLIMNKEIDSYFKTALKQGGALYISPLELLCENEACQTIVGSNPYKDLIIFDNGHLTESGSIYFVKNFILPRINFD